MLRDGTAMVEVRVLQPVDPALDTHLTVALVGALPLASRAGSSPAPLASPPSVSPPVPPPSPAAAAAAAPPLTSPPVATPAAVPPVIKPAPVTSAPVRTLFVQAGAFTAPDNAQRLADKLRSEGYTQVFVRDDLIAGRKFYRVRIGPIPDVPQFDRIVAALEQEGVRDAHLVLD